MVVYDRDEILGFLRDYVAVFPAVIAVILGVFAVYTTHFPFKATTSKMAFIISVIILSVSAISSTFYSQHLIVSHKHIEQARLNFVRDHLEKFYVSGGDILFNPIPKDISNADFNIYVNSFNKWTRKVSNWILINMGQSAQYKFLDQEGISIVNWGRSVNPVHNEIINLLEIYRKNLSDLIENPAWDQKSPR